MLGGIVTALVACGVSFGVARLALALASWAWVRLQTIFLYVAPRYRRGLYRHIWNRPDDGAFTNLADDICCRRRNCRPHHGFIRFKEWPHLHMPGNGSAH